MRGTSQTCQWWFPKISHSRDPLHTIYVPPYLWNNAIWSGQCAANRLIVMYHLGTELEMNKWTCCWDVSMVGPFSTTDVAISVVVATETSCVDSMVSAVIWSAGSTALLFMNLQSTFCVFRCIRIISFLLDVENVCVALYVSGTCGDKRSHI